ncbi:MAG: hypothetical protein HY691_07470 [Chloroflexi bacterium]|nr:hypothetical protein [Chloroflexota bacterium]
MRREALLLGLAAALAALLDAGLGTWPLGAAGWLALLGVLCVEHGAAVAGAAALALAAALAPPAVVALPLAALAALRVCGRAYALRFAAVAVAVLALGLAARSLAGWPPPTPAAVAVAPLTAGALNLWWVLLEATATHLPAGVHAARLPLYMWSLIAWLPFYALAAFAVWRGTAAVGAAAALAVFTFGTIATGQGPADGLPAAVLGLVLVRRGGWWPLLAGGVLAATLASLALAPLSVPPSPAPRVAVDARTLAALARVGLLAVWAVALVAPLWQRLPERWRRLLAAEPPGPSA